MSATAAVLNLSSWTGVVPVILPWGEPTLSSVGVASAGVAVPFFCYVVAMFMVIVPIWMNNFDSDKQAQMGSQFTAVAIEGEVIRDFPQNGDYEMQYPVGMIPSGSLMSSNNNNSSNSSSNRNNNSRFAY